MEKEGLMHCDLGPSLDATSSIASLNNEHGTPCIRTELPRLNNIDESGQDSVSLECAEGENTITKAGVYVSPSPPMLTVSNSTPP